MVESLLRKYSKSLSESTKVESLSKNFQIEMPIPV